MCHVKSHVSCHNRLYHYSPPSIFLNLKSPHQKLLTLISKPSQEQYTQYSVMMMEIESATVTSPTSPSMQIMTRPATATPATDDEELEEGNTATFLRTAETFLRLLPIGLCVSALVLMLKNSQENDYGSVSYTDFGAFRYLVIANGICAAYSLLSAVLIAIPRPTARRAWTLFFLDQVITYIILSAGASTMDVKYLAEHGDSATLWNSACGYFGKFCHKITASVAITFVALVCYVFLSIISSYKLFSKFDVPANSPAATGTGEE